MKHKGHIFQRVKKLQMLNLLLNFCLPSLFNILRELHRSSCTVQFLFCRCLNDADYSTVASVTVVGHIDYLYNSNPCLVVCSGEDLRMTVSKQFIVFLNITDGELVTKRAIHS